MIESDSRVFFLSLSLHRTVTSPVEIYPNICLLYEVRLGQGIFHLSMNRGKKFRVSCNRENIYLSRDFNSIKQDGRLLIKSWRYYQFLISNFTQKEVSFVYLFHVKRMNSIVHRIYRIYIISEEFFSARNESLPRINYSSKLPLGILIYLKEEDTFHYLPPRFLVHLISQVLPRLFPSTTKCVYIYIYH